MVNQKTNETSPDNSIVHAMFAPSSRARCVITCTETDQRRHTNVCHMNVSS